MKIGPSTYFLMVINKNVGILLAQYYPNVMILNSLKLFT